jgi:HAD superfamily hydrolase (TIGR01509 family)
MNKMIIFDWGGVILKEYPEHYCDRDAITETMKKFNNNLTDDEAYQLYIDTLKDENNKIISILNDYEDKYKWYQRINKKGHLNTTYEEFINEFINNYIKIDKYEEVVNYIYTLKEKCKIALFSDLIFVCFNALENHIDLNIFDKVFLSYEEGYTKSNLKSFINVENKLNIESKNILFIDNNEENINNAKKCGWNTCLAYGYELDKIKSSVNEFLKN